MRGLLRQDIRPSPAATSHLDGCLGCRACEWVCPAGVPYGELIDETRAAVPLDRQRSLPIRLLARAIRTVIGADPRWIRLMDRLARRIGRIIPHSGHHLARPGSPRIRYANVPWAAAVLDPLSTYRGDVGLFLGCIARMTDQNTLHDSITALRRYGYRVHVPAGQGCCGALHWHEGDRRGAIRLARRNIAAFRDSRIGQVVSTASACSTMLREYGRHFADEADAVRFADRSIDITELLAREKPIALQPVVLRIAVHQPCTMRSACSRPDATGTLLRQLPGISLIPLPIDTGCCGAGGAHQLLRGAEAKAIRETTLDAIRTIDPDLVVTTNVGCAMHLHAGLANANSRCDVRHPVSLIAEQSAS